MNIEEIREKVRREEEAKGHKVGPEDDEPFLKRLKNFISEDEGELDPKEDKNYLKWPKWYRNFVWGMMYTSWEILERLGMEMPDEVFHRESYHKVYTALEFIIIISLTMMICIPIFASIVLILIHLLK